MDQKERDSLSNELLKYKNFLQQREEEIRQGKNNYSLLGSVLGIHDEVRLHSRFIYSMINPNGSHFQNDLFLKLFIESIDPKILDTFNLSNAQVFKERDNIDLLIEDGNTFIIIENKLYAGDQKNQISRYIETIKKRYSNEIKLEIIVVYLSITGKNPSKYSLGEYELIENNKKLALNEQIYCYFPINYKSHINAWITNCLNKVQNISNLANAFLDYQTIINRVNKTMNKNHVTSFQEDVLNRSESEQEAYLELSANIMQNFYVIWAKLILETIYSVQNFETFIIDGTNNVLNKENHSETEIVKIISEWLLERKNCLKGFGVHFTNNNRNKKFMLMFATKILYIGEYTTDAKELYAERKADDGLFNYQHLSKVICDPNQVNQIRKIIKNRIEILINQE